MVIVSQKIDLSFYNVKQHLKGQSYSTLLSRTMGSFFSWDNAGQYPTGHYRSALRLECGCLIHQAAGIHTCMQAGMDAEILSMKEKGSNWGRKREGGFGHHLLLCRSVVCP